MRYYIATFGCQMNKSDSERIVSVLEKKGYSPASTINEADFIMVNMCSVRQSAVDRVFGLAQKFAKLKTLPAGRRVKTILTGCIIPSEKKKFAPYFDEIISIKDLLKSKQYHELVRGTVYVPISNGCNNACTYCVVPFTRGALVCRKPAEIIKEIKEAVKKWQNPPTLLSSGEAREIWLLGQNVNDYESKGINFAKLLKMADEIAGDFQIRFMSPNPKDFSDELIKAMAKSKKVARFLNLPVQSGDNKILKKMNRKYTVSQYKKLVQKIRKAMPDINLSTDAIVGFPGETEKQFQNTVKLFKEIKFNTAYISKYSPRSSTAAFKLKDDVFIKEKKRRWKILNLLLS